MTVGGHTWQVCEGSNGADQVLPFIRTGNTNAGTVDVLASASGGKTFTTDSCSVSPS